MTDDAKGPSAPEYIVTCPKCGKHTIVEWSHMPPGGVPPVICGHAGCEYMILSETEGEPVLLSQWNAARQSPAVGRLVEAAREAADAMDVSTSCRYTGCGMAKAGLYAALSALDASPAEPTASEIEETARWLCNSAADDPSKVWEWSSKVAQGTFHKMARAVLRRERGLTPEAR